MICFNLGFHAVEQASHLILSGFNLIQLPGIFSRLIGAVASKSNAAKKDDSDDAKGDGDGLKPVLDSPVGQRFLGQNFGSSDIKIVL